jgi:hypothetical protein
VVLPNGGGVGRPVGVADATGDGVGVGFGVALPAEVKVAAGDGVGFGVELRAGVGVEVVATVGVGAGTPAITKISSSDTGCAPVTLESIW